MFTVDEFTALKELSRGKLEGLQMGFRGLGVRCFPLWKHWIMQLRANS